ncbi:hypothetical protein [Streptomyces triculaminicus]|uniref:hypothetical protein n=1 Tax=Streptomyces triculaminicus TaxID=2816232 RepID=UPI0037A0BA21
MNHRTSFIAASFGAGAMAAATLQASHSHEWHLTASYATVALLLALLAHHEHQAALTARVALVRARRAQRLRRRPDPDALTTDWCCDRWFVSRGREHLASCPAFASKAAS